jgi:hypothetical protein
VTTDYGTSSTPTDPDEIRREIEQTQAHLSNDVDALAEKVTPGRIVERRVARVRGTAARWKDKVMGSSTEAARQATGSISGTASAGASGVSNAASTAASGVSDAVSTTADTVAAAPEVARRQAKGNPLAAGLIAFGTGWLISSLLPATRREQELADEARSRATELGAPVAEAAKGAATEVKDNLAGPAQQAVDSVRSTATDAGRSVADEGRAAAERVQGQAQESAGTVRENAPS